MQLPRHASPTDLVQRYGSPLYVYDAESVRRSYRRFRAAFPYQATDIHYAIVCNKNAYLVRILVAEGAGIHANTPGDIFAARAMGVSKSRIVYSGTNLSGDDFAFALSECASLNLDSLDQLRRVLAISQASADKLRRIGLRLLIDDEGRPNRIGVTVDELPEAIALTREAGVDLDTLHMYAGTNTRRTSRFLECFDRLEAASEQLPNLACLDIGGGFGLSYAEGQEPLALESLGAVVSARMEALSQRRGRSVALVVEPGRFLVGDAGSLYVTVVAVKERGGRRYIGVDSTVGNLVVPSVYHSTHTIRAVSARGPVSDIPTDICGNTTHSRDYLGRKLRLPELREGDLLEICDVGAYGYAMSSHFLNRPRPAEVVVDTDETVLTTRRETFGDLLATQELS